MQPETDPRRGLPSCSALERLSRCPASFQLGKQAEAAGLVPPADESADSGTRIHRWLETGEEADWDALSHDEQETAARCESARIDLVASWQPSDGGDIQHLKEHRLGLTSFGTAVDVTPETEAELILTGMADHIALDIQARSALVVDYKTGRGEVEQALRNLQLTGLAVLAAKRWRLKQVRVAIVQPLTGEPTVADYDAQALNEAAKWLKEVAETAAHPMLEAMGSGVEISASEFSAGDWCQYCPARAICPALREVATSAPDALEVESLPAEPKAALSAMTARALDFPAQKLADLLHGRRMLGWYVSAIEAAARIRLERGESVPGYELRDRAGRRKITDAQKAADAVAPLLAGAEGGSAAALLRCATLSAKSLQDEVQRASGKKSRNLYNMTVKDAKKALENALGSLMECPTSKVLAETGAAIGCGEEAA